MLFPLLKINVPLVEQKILSYIGPEDLVSMAFVCKEWYRAVGNKRTRACLLKAVETGCEHLVTYILEDFNESGEWIGWGLIGTAFVHAAEYKKERIVKHLLARKDIDVDVEIGKCFTALTVKDLSGREPRVTTLRLGRREIVTLLRKSGYTKEIGLL